MPRVPLPRRTDALTAGGPPRTPAIRSKHRGLCYRAPVRSGRGAGDLGTAYLDHDLVLAREDENPLAPDGVTKRFAEIVEDAGLRRIRVHDLRHGRASLLLPAGVDIAVVSR
ncbi:tyrosine-type recombinase/integrase [Nocardioides sp. cx-173]|uniref:tyrosine-type recombinase/integrase n=1 Tax=Nocardioides sp. cx-173 TaxID=2898796 RepID=UPI0035B44425